MRTQKRLLIVSFYAAPFAFASAALFTFVLNAWDGQGFWKGLSFAVLGSAAMGVLLSLTEYMVMRRTTLEEYYLAASDCLRAFSKAAFFYVRGPKGLLSDYYSENFPVSPKVPHPAKDALRKYIADEYLTFLDSSVHIPGSELSKRIEEKLHQAIQECDEALKNTLRSYIEIAEYSLAPLENAYGKLDFLFGNRSFRADIYDRIHQPLQEYKRFVEEKGSPLPFFPAGGAGQCSDDDGPGRGNSVPMLPHRGTHRGRNGLHHCVPFLQRRAGG